MNLIIFILICYGLTQILCYGKIFDNIRPKEDKWGELFSCSMCMGFHVGWVVAVLTNFSGLIEWNLNTLDYLFLGFISSGTSYILDKIVSDEGIRLEKK